MLPCDEQEQDRLDILHKVMMITRGGRLSNAPHRANARILDLGCGTGIWAIDMAHKYHEAFLVGVDLSAIQPDNAPSNCDFYAPFDFESPWSLGEESWDLIHIQLGAGSVISWPSLYRRVYAHLRPDSWFEQVDIEMLPQCDDRSTNGLALTRVYNCLRQAFALSNREIEHDPRRTIQGLQAAGFSEINHQSFGLPFNPRNPYSTQHEKTLSTWYNLAVFESLETLCLAAFTRVLGMTVEETKRLAAQARAEAYGTNMKIYNVLHNYIAWKA